MYAQNDGIAVKICAEGMMNDLEIFRAHLHQVSVPMLLQLCDDTRYTVLIEKNGVA